MATHFNQRTLFAGNSTIYTHKLANLGELKQSLLQKAFTGQLTTASVSEEIMVSARPVGGF